MARISRKDLKKDEFRETFTHGAEAVSLHRRGFSLILTVALIVLAAVLGWRYYSQRQTAQASVALADAMKVFNAPVNAAGAPDQPGGISYTDEKNKYNDAATKLADIAAKYGRTRPGQQALYFDALCQVHMNQIDLAVKNLQSAADRGTPDIVALANYQLATIYAGTGKIAQAIQLYQQLIAKPEVVVPKPLAMLSLADIYSSTNPPEAVKLLNQIKQEFPGSAAADEASKRLGTPPGQS